MRKPPPGSMLKTYVDYLEQLKSRPGPSCGELAARQAYKSDLAALRANGVSADPLSDEIDKLLTAAAFAVETATDEHFGRPDPPPRRGNPGPALWPEVVVLIAVFDEVRRNPLASPNSWYQRAAERLGPSLDRHAVRRAFEAKFRKLLRVQPDMRDLFLTAIRASSAILAELDEQLRTKSAAVGALSAQPVPPKLSTCGR